VLGEIPQQRGNHCLAQPVTRAAQPSGGVAEIKKSPLEARRQRQRMGLVPSSELLCDALHRAGPDRTFRGYLSAAQKGKSKAQRRTLSPNE
jgi:hypothetical protein